MRLETVEYQQLALNAIEVLHKASGHDRDSIRALEKIRAAVAAALGGDDE